MAEAAFQRLQRQFAAHLRDPHTQAAPPGIEERRLQIYRELFYNNIEDCLASAFPVLRAISPDAAWHARVRDFYASHRCEAPQFHQIAAEFLRYLEEERGEHPDDPPFLRELAHYEWVELALDVAEEEIGAPLPAAADELAAAPVPSPLAWSLSYEWPVHRISAGFQPERPLEQPVYLLVWRNRSDQVRFMETNAVTARLLQLVEERPAVAARELLLQLAAEMDHPQPQAVIEQGRAILRDLRERDILL
jgi:hypothetical protein